MSQNSVDLPEGIIKPYIFINYASDDRDLAVWVETRLLENGYLNRVWLDRKQLEGGDEWKDEIDAGLRRSFVMLSILTPISVAPSRRWVLYEQTEALRLFVPIVPLRFELCDVPDHLKPIQYLDLIQDREASFSSVLSAIQKHEIRDGDRLIDQTPSVGRTFIGREKELGQVYQTMRGNRKGVVTAKHTTAIYGMGGIGKTLLAEELVRRLGPRYPGGVIVERRGENAEPAEIVLKRWMKYVTGNSDKTDKKIKIKPSDVLASFQNQGAILVIFDDVWEADFFNIRKLLRAFPVDAARLITTRSKIGAESIGCKLYPLPGLTMPDALELLYDRLRDKGPAPDEALFTRLIMLVNGHPLSLELAAGRCTHTTDLLSQVERLEQRLPYGLDELTIEMQIADKDTSVALSLQESITALDETDKRLNKNWTHRFKGLGVIPPSTDFDLQLAAGIWGDVNLDVTRETLDALYNRALLDRRHDTGHYFLHPLLHAYAYALLRAERELFTQISRSYQNFVIKIAKEIFEKPLEEWRDSALYFPHINYVGDQLVKQVEAFLDPLRPLAQPAPSQLPLAESFSEIEIAILNTGITFAESVCKYISERPEVARAGQVWLWMGLATSRILTLPRLVGLFLNELGNWHGELGETRIARQYLNSALQIRRDNQDPDGEGETLHNLAITYDDAGNFEKAIKLFEQALPLRRGAGQLAEALTLNSMGAAYEALGKHKEALALFRRALAIRRKKPLDLAGQGVTLHNIGDLYRNKGNRPKALEYFKAALPLLRKTGNKRKRAITIEALGTIYLAEQRPDMALRCFRATCSFEEKVGNRMGQGASLNNIGVAYLRQGQFTKALETFEEALVLRRMVKDKIGEARTLRNIGLTFVESGQFKQAIAPLQRALTLFQVKEGKKGQKITMPALEAEVLQLLGQVYIQLALQVLQSNELGETASGITAKQIQKALNALSSQRKEGR